MLLHVNKSIRGCSSKAVAAAFCLGASDDTGATGVDDAAPTVDERPILVQYHGPRYTENEDRH